MTEKNTTTSHGDALLRMATAKRDRMGFLTAEDVAVIAADDRTRLTQVLVRCGGCRFACGAQDVTRLIELVTRDGAEYVRDVSLIAGRV